MFCGLKASTKTGLDIVDFLEQSLFDRDIDGIQNQWGGGEDPDVDGFGDVTRVTVSINGCVSLEDGLTGRSSGRDSDDCGLLRSFCRGRRGLNLGSEECPCRLLYFGV